MWNRAYVNDGVADEMLRRCFNMMKGEGKENDKKPNPEIVFMERYLVGCKVIKKNDT